MSLFGRIPFWTPTRFPEAICPRYGPVYIDDIDFSSTLIWYHTYTRTCRHKLTHPHIHDTKRVGSIDWHIHINILLIPTAAISQTAAICITVNDWLAETNFTLQQVCNIFTFQKLLFCRKQIPAEWNQLDEVLPGIHRLYTDRNSTDKQNKNTHIHGNTKLGRANKNKNKWCPHFKNNFTNPSLFIGKIWTPLPNLFFGKLEKLNKGERENLNWKLQFS